MTPAWRIILCTAWFWLTGMIAFDWLAGHTGDRALIYATAVLVALLVDVLLIRDREEC